MAGVSGPLHHQLGRFLVVGSCTVAVDFLGYRALLLLDLPVDLAKATSFLVATVLAYALNRAWTFRSPPGTRQAVRFAAVYGVTLLVNVAVNAAALRLLDGAWQVEIAFLCAQACSTTLNFLAMRHLVFVTGAPTPSR